MLSQTNTEDWRDACFQSTRAGESRASASPGNGRGESRRPTPVTRGDVRIYLLANPELAARVKGSEITIVVEEVDALFAEHQERDAPVTMAIQNEPWGSREYHVTDPNGYVLRFSGEQI